MAREFLHRNNGGNGDKGASPKPSPSPRVKQAQASPDLGWNFNRGEWREDMLLDVLFEWSSQVDGVSLVLDPKPRLVEEFRGAYLGEKRITAIIKSLRDKGAMVLFGARDRNTPWLLTVSSGPEEVEGTASWYRRLGRVQKERILEQTTEQFGEGWDVVR